MNKKLLLVLTLPVTGTTCISRIEFLTAAGKTVPYVYSGRNPPEYLIGQKINKITIN